MQEICPISEEQLNERIVRSNATLVSLALLGFLFTGNAGFTLFLSLDFLIRGFRLEIPSPIGILSRYATKLLNLGFKPINAAPKVFAAKIGFVFSLVICLLSFFGFTLTSYFFASIMLTFSLLEALIGLCVACKIYTICCRLGFVK